MKHYLLTLLLIFSPLFSQSQSPTLISDRNIVFERPSSQKDGNPTNFSVPHRYLTQGMHPYLQTVFSGCFADEKCHLLHPYTQHSLDLLKSTLRVIYNADKNFKVIHGKDAQTPPSVFEKDLHALFIRKLNAATIMDFIVLIDEVHLTMCHNPLAEVLCAVTDPEDIVDKILNDPGITFHNDFMQSIKKFLILYHADNEKVVAFRKKEADISCSLQEAFQTRMKTHPTREFLYKNYQDEDDNTSERSYTLNLTADVPNSYALEYDSDTLADYYDYTYDPDCTSDAIVLPLSDIKDVHTIIPMLGGTGKKITAIKINNNKITDLTPLEKIPSITTLILDAQQAKNMDKSGIVIPRQISTIKVISENFSFFKKSILNYFKRIDMEENKVATQRIIFTLVFERIKNEKTK